MTYLSSFGVSTTYLPTLNYVTKTCASRLAKVLLIGLVQI